MDTYMSEHQDRSRNALQKAAEASFLAWCEELKADQAQFLSEKILCLGCASNTYFMPTVFEGSYAKITQTRRTFQRMNLYILVLKLPPLWNVFYLSRAHTYIQTIQHKASQAGEGRAESTHKAGPST